jgi:hypothetical protein
MGGAPRREDAVGAEGPTGGCDGGGCASTTKRKGSIGKGGCSDGGGWRTAPPVDARTRVAAWGVSQRPLDGGEELTRETTARGKSSIEGVE